MVPANIDIATQEIVQMAEDADPTGRRTLGVLTKPDLVDKGAEDKVSLSKDMKTTELILSGPRISPRVRRQLWPWLYHGLQSEPEQP